MNNIDEIFEKETEFFSVFTKVPTKVLLSVLSKMNKEVDEDGKEVYIARYKFEGIGDLTNHKSKKVKLVKQLFDDLLGTQAEVFTEQIYKKANLVSKYCLREDSTAEITLSNDTLTKKLMNKDPHIILDEFEFSTLKTKFSREFYRLLRGARYDGELLIPKVKLFKALRVPKSYNDLKFIEKILTPTFEELDKHFEWLSFDNLETNGTGELPEICKFTFKKYDEGNLDKVFNGKSKEEIELFKLVIENNKLKERIVD